VCRANYVFLELEEIYQLSYDSLNYRKTLDLTIILKLFELLVVKLMYCKPSYLFI